MKLGLDLRGGVHFLMEVDMETALGKLQEQNLDGIRSLLRENSIPFASVRKSADYGVEVRFRDDASRSEASSLLSKRLRDLVFKDGTDNTLTAVMSDQRLSEARSYAVMQNITILRNRVNQLGVAEPLVQRQGADRIVVELPVFRTPHGRKKSSGQLPPWNSVWSTVLLTLPLSKQAVSW